MEGREKEAGLKYDAGKSAMDLLPFDALAEVGAVLEYGRVKYAARNWEKGMSWGRLVAASMRHLAAWMMGQESDTESGQRHLAHFACCALMLCALTKRNVGTDDRKVTE